jgi:hypothetical protein
VNRLEKNGGDLKDAAKNTWKYMIQYDQVTPWEKDVARRVIPFYTWMKKNLALQLDGLYRGATLQDLKPAIRMKKQGQMLNMFSQMSDDPSSDQEFKPEFLNSTFSFRLPDNVTQHFNKWMGGNDNLFVSIDLPVQALNDLGLQQLLQKTVSSLSPVAVMANLGMGYKTYPEPYGPVEKFKGEMKAVPWAMTLLPESLWKPLGMAPIRDKQSGQMVV